MGNGKTSGINGAQKMIDADRRNHEARIVEDFITGDTQLTVLFPVCVHIPLPVIRRRGIIRSERISSAENLFVIDVHIAEISDVDKILVIFAFG